MGFEAGVSRGFDECTKGFPEGHRNVPAGSPIFLIERTSYTTGNRPVDYERLHYRGDLIRFVTRLVRRPGAAMQR
jgi:UTRA domain